MFLGYFLFFRPSYTSNHQTLSRAPDISNSNAIVYLFSDSIIFLLISTIASFVDLPLMNPYCLSEILFVSNDVSIRRIFNSFSYSFPIMDRRQIGL